ncbi:hypothetical protein [Maricaulis sp.]|uniref:hypothetical protein n=1 Tax=Maricaulis sp. TaxID=1486257 RepID=UPI002609B77E|nr:hypothetical protein [Maricaulis sp.]
MKLYAALAAGVFLTACATTTTDTSANAVETAAAGDEDVICQRETPLGTRLPSRRVCRTAEEWARVREQSQEYARDMQRSPQQSPFEGEN